MGRRNATGKRNTYSCFKAKGSGEYGTTARQLRVACLAGTLLVFSRRGVACAPAAPSLGACRRLGQYVGAGSCAQLHWLAPWHELLPGAASGRKLVRGDEPARGRRAELPGGRQAVHPPPVPSARHAVVLPECKEHVVLLLLVLVLVGVAAGTDAVKERLGSCKRMPSVCCRMQQPQGGDRPQPGSIAHGRAARGAGVRRAPRVGHWASGCQGRESAAPGALPGARSGAVARRKVVVSHATDELRGGVRLAVGGAGCGKCSVGAARGGHVSRHRGVEGPGGRAAVRRRGGGACGVAERAVARAVL